MINVKRTTSTKRGADIFPHDGLSSGETQGHDDEVDGLDADKRKHDAAQAVDQQIAAQERGRADRTIVDTLQRQRNERDDDQRIEDDRRQDGALRRVRAAMTLSTPSCG